MNAPKKNQPDPGTVSDENAAEIGFAAAMDELNAIVAELEAADVDVDVMAERVERAAFLVSLCRDRLDATRFRVEEIIVRLDGGEESQAAESQAAESQAEFQATEFQDKDS